MGTSTPWRRQRWVCKAPYHAARKRRRTVGAVEEGTEPTISHTAHNPSPRANPLPWRVTLQAASCLPGPGTATPASPRSSSDEASSSGGEGSKAPEAGARGPASPFNRDVPVCGAAAATTASLHPASIAVPPPSTRVGGECLPVGSCSCCTDRVDYSLSTCSVGMSHMAEYACCSSVAFERPSEKTFTFTFSFTLHHVPQWQGPFTQIYVC
jgi:hypothetical protein